MFPNGPKGEYSNKVLICGGSQSNQSLIVTYDPVKNTTSIKRIKAEMKTNRSNHRVVAYQDYFYALGGIVNNQNASLCCERIKISDVETASTWQ